MLIAGVILIVIGLVAGGIGWWQHRKLMELVSVETSTVADLRELADAVNQTEEAAGAFSQRCEIVGVVKPGSGGGLDGPHSGQKCVWYRETVTEKYWDYEYRGTGDERRRERVEKSRTLSDSSSELDFLIDDGTGTVVVEAHKVDVDEPRKVYDQFTRDGDSALESIVESIAGSLMGGGNTIGVQTEEWIVPLDTRVFAQGEAKE